MGKEILLKSARKSSEHAKNTRAIVGERRYAYQGEIRKKVDDRGLKEHISDGEGWKGRVRTCKRATSEIKIEHHNVGEKR
jgi:hypothetical protein